MFRILSTSPNYNVHRRKDRVLGAFAAALIAAMNFVLMLVTAVN